MYHNIYQSVSHLHSVAPKSGGLCSITFFKWEDVLVWPSMNPATGVLADAVQLKPGGTFYTVDAPEKDKFFKEEDKTGPEGPYVEMQLAFTVAGNSGALLLYMKASRYHQFGFIVKDKDGLQRLIGNEDSGARIIKTYNSGDADSSRKWTVNIAWQHPDNAPIYTAAAFAITVGGVTITAGALTLILRFRVGDSGAPMVEGDTELINAGFANTRLLVLADGTAIPIDYGEGDIDFTGTLTRYIIKSLASTTLDFQGSVMDKETIEIYAFSS